MKNKDIENSLSKKEKDNIYTEVGTALVFCEWESEKIEPFRRNFLIYCALNKIPEYKVFSMLIQTKFNKKMIKKYDLLRKWE